MAYRVTGVDVAATRDGWIVSAGRCEVVQLRVDHGFSLIIDGGYGSVEIRIEQPFQFRLEGDGGFTDVNPSDVASLASVLPVLHAKVDRVVAFHDGRLEIVFRTGGCLRVSPAPKFESWTVAGPDGLRLVSMPGGEVSVWRPGQLTGTSGE
jgi:Family of unknown function (DUF6188)